MTSKIFSTSKFQFANLTLENPFISGPMVGLSHLILRDIIADFGGVGLMFTEMLDARILIKEDIVNNPWLEKGKMKCPLIYQIFVSNTSIAKEAAIRLVDMKVDGIDINMGCAAPKIRNNDSGVMLMTDKRLAVSIVKSIRSVYKGTLTAKIRTGYEDNIDATIDFVKSLIDAGIDAVFYHPRLGKQKFKARAKWDYVSMLKDAVNIPVIGNGDIKTAEEAIETFANYRTDGVMISRASAIKPWIFKEIEHLRKNKDTSFVVDKKKVWLDFAGRLPKFFEKREALEKLNKWTELYAKNFAFGHSFWVSVSNAKT